MTAERHEFQAEVKQLLDLMVHSLYSDKDVFLRELISNSSDALDKLRFERLTTGDHGAELHIELSSDAIARTLTIADNGIGMTRDEVIANIGTIAKSRIGSSSSRASLARQARPRRPSGSRPATAPTRSKKPSARSRARRSRCT